MKEVVIQARNIEVDFWIQKYGVSSMKEYLLSLGRKSLFERRNILKGVNLEIFKGENFGIVGKNGAGKSTLLRVLAGIIRPSRGSLKVCGRIAPLLALGVGLEPDLSGRENIKLCSTLMGLTGSEIRQSMKDIIEFAELSDSIDLQVKRYSSGMLARLAFSIATAIEPDILIIDEALSVGDLGFQKKCADRMDEIRRTGCTVIYVSHSPQIISNLCTRAACLEEGLITLIGDTDEVMKYYKSRF